jgi:hypothetical protein
MSGRLQVDIGKLYKAYTGLMFPDWGGASRATNLDGLVVYPGQVPKEGLLAYVQVFRSGAVELLRFGGSVFGDRPLIPSTSISTFIRDAIGRGISCLKKQGAAGPAIIAGAFLNVRGLEFALDQRIFRLGDQAIADRTDLLLPETWLDDLAAFADVDTVARPMLDVLWQAFDVERCYEYDEEGRWKRG